MKVKEESEKVGLKLNIQKIKIMASGLITSWQIYGETVETVRDFIFLGSKITADGDCSHEIKRRLLLGREKAMAPHSSTLAWKIPWMEDLVGCSPWGREELDTTEQLHFHFSLSWIGEGNGTPLQCSWLENPRDGGAWWASVCGVSQSRTVLKWQQQQFLGRKAMTNLDSMLKSRDITLPTKVHLSKLWFF